MNLPATSETLTKSNPEAFTALILLGVWFLTTLGTGLIPLEQHETFVLESAREMRASRDWILPLLHQASHPLLH